MSKKLCKVQVTSAITLWHESELTDIFTNPDEVQIVSAVEYNGSLYLIYLIDENDGELGGDECNVLNDTTLQPTPKYQHIQQLCPKCNGEGKINNEPGTSSSTSRLCPVCSGTMTVTSTIHF